MAGALRNHTESPLVTGNGRPETPGETPDSDMDRTVAICCLCRSTTEVLGTMAEFSVWMGVNDAVFSGSVLRGPGCHQVAMGARVAWDVLWDKPFQGYFWIDLNRTSTRCTIFMLTYVTGPSKRILLARQEERADVRLVAHSFNAPQDTFKQAAQSGSSCCCCQEIASMWWEPMIWHPNGPCSRFARPE